MTSETTTWVEPGTDTCLTPDFGSNPALDDTDYDRFRELVLARTGMIFDSRRRRGLAAGVRKAAGWAGIDALDDYYRLLESAKTDSETWDGLIGAITIGETYFFRNDAHISALRNHILPKLIAERRNVRRLRIWSAGCASGEEPYTLAILLNELIPDIKRWNIHILGTDINAQVIARANKAVYRSPSFRRTDSEMQSRYFDPCDDGWRLKREVRKLVSFAYLNLAEDAYPSLATNTNALDLILCRNVAIYLPEPVTKKIANRFANCLVPDGWLLVGASETNNSIYSRFDAVRLDRATVYRKPDDTVQPTAIPDAREPQTLTPVSPTPTAPPPPDRDRQPPAAPGVSDGLDTDIHQDGLDLMAEGHYDEAIACFRESIARDPDSAPTRCCEIAEAFANEGRLEMARSWCNRAIEADPLSVQAYYILSIIDQEEGLLGQATAHLKKTLYLEPESPLAHFSLANVYRETGREGDAVRHLRQTIRLASTLPEDDILPGAEGVTVGRLLAMARAIL